MANALNAPPESDPWAWAQWARTQDPGTYNLGGGALSSDPNFIKTAAPMLKAAGLWNPEWDSWANFTPDYTDSGNGGSFGPAPDFSSLAGYSLQNTRGPENSAFMQLLGPDGQQAGLEQYEQSGSWKSKDYLEMAAAAAAMFGGGMALNGGFAGLGAGAGAGAGAEAGIGTLGSIAPGSAALAPIGSTGLGTVGGLTAGLGELGSVGAGLGAAGAAGGGAAGASGGLSGAWNGVNFGGAGGNSLMGSLSSMGNSLLSPSGLANLASTGLGLYGQNKALGAMQNATNQSNDLQREMFNTIRADNQPLVDMRNGVLPQIQALLKNPGSITSDPGYQFQFNEGTKALNNGAAARGMTYSGAQGKALQRYGNDYGSTKLDQSLNRLTNVAGLGQVGSNSNNNAAGNYGANVGNNLMNQGNANASMYAGGAGLVNNALLNVFDQNQYRRINGRGG